jgi:hypothetical protein
MENGASACTTFATNETIDFGNSTLEAGNIFSKKRMDNYRKKRYYVAWGKKGVFVLLFQLKNG